MKRPPPRSEIVFIIMGDNNGRQERGAVETPLCNRCKCAERCPGEQMATDEGDGRKGRVFALAALPVDLREQQDHGGGRRDHHGDVGTLQTAHPSDATRAYYRDGLECARVRGRDPHLENVGISSKDDLHMLTP